MSSIREQALELLIEQYRESPRVISFFNALLEQTDDIEALFEQLRLIKFIDIATGHALDNLGRIVVLDRPYTELDPDLIFTFNGPQGGGFDEGYFISLNAHGNVRLQDLIYRTLIRSKILLNTTSCTLEEMNKSLSLILLNTTFELNNGVGYVELAMPRAPTAYENMLIEATFPLTAGVRLVIDAGGITTPIPTTPIPTTPAPTTSPPTTLPGNLYQGVCAQGLALAAPAVNISTRQGICAQEVLVGTQSSSNLNLADISQVGSTVTGTLSIGSSSQNINLPAGLQAGDLVFVLTAFDASDYTDGIGEGAAQGYTVSDFTSQAISHQMGYKIMGSTPDSTVTLSQNNQRIGVYIIQAFRGIDPSNILDVEIPTRTSSIGSVASPPAITPVTDGALVLVLGLLDDDDATVSSYPGGYGASASVNTGQSAVDDLGATIAIASKICLAGVEDPGDFTFSSSDNWVAHTIAFRPTQGSITTTPPTTLPPTTLPPTTLPPTTPPPTTLPGSTSPPTTEPAGEGDLFYVKTTGTRTSGASTPDNWTDSNCYGTVSAACQAMSGGDEVVVDSGTYVGINNVIGRYNYWNIPSGTSNQYTKIRARYPFEVTIDSGTAYGYYDRMIFISGDYIHVDGFRGINQDGSNNGFIGIYGSYNKLTRCQVRTTAMNGEGHIVMISGSSASYNLIEDCALTGNYRYGFQINGSSSSPHHNILRRCVARGDYSSSTEPFSPFAIYGHQTDAAQGPHDNVFQNCIGIDMNAGVPDAAWKFYGPLYIFKGNYNNVLDSCIFVKNDQTGTESGSWFDAAYGGYGNQLINSVMWGYKNGGLVLGSGLALVEGCTFGSPESSYGIRASSFPSGAPFRNSLFLPSGMDNRYGTISTASYNSFAAGTTFGTNLVSYQSDCTYLPRVNNNSNRKTAGYGGGRVGAHIIYRLGESSTLYGQSGWNTLTSTILWPWPYEADIKEFFAVTNNPVSGAQPTSNNTTRGFCASGMSLTKYIWELLGQSVPGDFDDSD